MSSAMTYYSSCYMYESPAIGNQPTFFGNCYNLAGNSEEIQLLNFYQLHPAFNPNHAPTQNVVYHGFIDSPQDKEVAHLASKSQNENEPADEGQQIPCYYNWNRPSEYDFFSGEYWRENFFSFGNGSHHDAYGNSMGKAQEPDQYEEDCASYFSYQEDTEYQSASDYDSWSSYQNWVGYGGEEDPFNQGAQEPIVPHSYSRDDMGFCEAIFGHWPCLFQKRSIWY
ncbi:MORN repeat-containing protein [Quillaja saponaria]|uniref:MORN repeat-containing protein n=1 Tax=Quillaja saponaria TaxID=32244 RepID=A0AAD7Q081_QUISA|nr:MORN repeat-containing protein [Quillaja saponaria]